MTIREKLREIKSVMLQWKCLPDGWTVSEPPPPSFTFLVLELGGLCPAIFVTFQNKKSDIHSDYVSDWSGEWRWVSKAEFGLLFQDLLLYSSHNYICHFSYVQMNAPLWTPSREDSAKMWAVWKIIRPYPSLWWQVFPSNVAVQNSYNPFCLQTWSDVRRTSTSRA